MWAVIEGGWREFYVRSAGLKGAENNPGSTPMHIQEKNRPGAGPVAKTVSAANVSESKAAARVNYTASEQARRVEDPFDYIV